MYHTLVSTCAIHCIPVSYHHVSIQGLYASIRSSPFIYHHGVDDLTEVFFNPDHEGYLVKEGTLITMAMLQLYDCLYCV